jgi:porin
MHNVTLIYSTLRATALTEISKIMLPPPPPPPASLETKHGSWSATYLYEQPLAPTWGVFASGGISDGDPNPIRWQFYGGIGGDGLLRGRPKDRFGLGYYYVGLSAALKDALSPAIRLRDEHGGELFYDFAVNDYLRLAADAQVIEPFRSRFNTATVLGIRGLIKL